MKTQDPKHHNVSKIVQMGEEKYVFKMIRDGYSMSEIHRKLSQKYGKGELSYAAVSRFLKNVKKKQGLLYQKDKGALKDYHNMVMNYNKELKTILEEVKDMKKIAKDELDFASYSALVGRLWQGIELIAKLSGDLKDGQQVNVTLLCDKVSVDEQNVTQDLRRTMTRREINVEAIILEEDEKKADFLEKTYG